MITPYLTLFIAFLICLFFIVIGSLIFCLFLFYNPFWGGVITAVYFIIINLFILIPYYIKRYLSIPHYKEKDLEYLILFILLTLPGIFGIIYFLRDFFRELTKATFLAFIIVFIIIFIPFVPFVICVYLRDKGNVK